MRTETTIKAKGLRTHCITGVTKEVDLAFELNDGWLWITKGGVTGYESIEIRKDIIQRTSENGWCANMGTKGKWDKLMITAEEMAKLWKENDNQ